MLERTAASLESCNLQRVLSKPPRSAKRCRQLHMGFWQHGASAIEISNTWPAIARSPEPEAADSAADRPVQTGLVASTFLLDFLYPNATIALLRRLYPSLPRPQESTAPGGPSRRRHFTSTTTAVDQSHSDLTIRHESGRLGGERDAKSVLLQNHVRQELDEPVTPCQKSFTEATASLPTSEATRRTELEKLQPDGTSKYIALSRLLSRQNEEHYHDVWDLYCRLGEHERCCARRFTVIYLSKSQSIVEIGRAISLFRHVSPEQWNDEFLAAGVLVLIRSGDLSSAIDKFIIGVESQGLSGGLEYLLADTIANQRWPVVLKIWLEYFSSHMKRNPCADTNTIHLGGLKTLPNLAKLYFSLDRYTTSEGAKVVRAINLHSTSRLGLNVLRRRLAEMALQQPCAPKQAIRILKGQHDTRLYEEYLVCMLKRWTESLEPKANLGLLSDIYSDYRGLSDSRPSIPLLQAMFEFHYPRDKADLHRIYRDWHDIHGELDQWGFEKYLKLYAAGGDVTAVRDLWTRYIALYPEVLKTPRAFRSTMNVYAQIGDVKKAEAELQTMADKYGVEPDLDIWNTLLKSYMRAGKYDQVLSCFTEICKMHAPDAFTYAHVMAMCAKKGDLENTLGFFNQAQEKNVPVSKEMALSIVNAYCRNDRLVDAERVCIELAERKATSSAVWNQLLYFNGIQGNLNKCYELLQTMKKFGVEWDRQTHEFLLQALVTVDQVQPAYHLLQCALEDKLFPVGPEHYSVVMNGAVRTGDLAIVETLVRQMRRTGQPMTLNALVAVVEAAFKKAPTATRTRALCEEFVNCLQSMLQARWKQPGRTAPGLSGDLMELRTQTQSIGKALMLLVEMRDFTNAEELVSLYSELVPDTEGAEAFAPRVASALMLGYLKEGRYRSIHKMWKQTWNRTLSRGQRQGGGIYPAHEYDLSRPLSIVIKAFREENDGLGLLSLIEQITAAGFKLTRSNWNMAIRYLAEMGQWERAMQWCETMLMPRWRGWSPGQRKIQERHEMKNTRVLQASKEAVLSLQMQWLRLRKLAAWSPNVSQKLREIEINYPMLHYAFITTDYDNISGTWVLTKRKSMTKSINDMLKPLSHDELKQMKKALEKQLVLERARHPRRSVKNPFHVLVSGSSKHPHTKALGHDDLVDLDTALQSKILKAEATGVVKPGSHERNESTHFQSAEKE